MPIKAQAAQVAQVKRFESGVVTDPIIVSPDMTVRKVLELIRQHNISGLPVVKAKRLSASLPTVICVLKPTSINRSKIS